MMKQNSYARDDISGAESFPVFARIDQSRLSPRWSLPVKQPFGERENFGRNVRVVQKSIKMNQCYLG